MLVDWLIPTLVMLPVLLAVLLGSGVPWALVILPRADWRDRPLVVALALALGAMILTTVMFLLGTFAQMTVAGTLIGVGLLVMLASGVIAPLLYGEPYLTSHWWTFPLGDYDVAVGTPLLFDIGVYLGVAGTVLLIVLSLEEEDT